MTSSSPLNFDSLPKLFFSQASKLKSQKFIWNKKSGDWLGVSYGEVARQIRDTASGLLARGIGRGDRVLIIAENSIEWVVADLAIMTIGAVSVPTFISNTESDHLHVLEDSGAVAVICSSKRFAATAQIAAETAPDCRLMIVVEKSKIMHQPNGLAIVPWQTLMQDGQKYAADIDDCINKTAKDDLACIIYTSGSDSNPKGVMLQHRAIIHNITAAKSLFENLNFQHEVFVSLLPLSHAYEHTTGLYLPILLGAEIYHVTAPDQLMQTLQIAKPTMMTAVPRLCEVIHDRIQKTIASSTPFTKRLIAKTIELGTAKIEGRKLSIGERVMDKALDMMVRQKFRKGLGGRLKVMVSGGAALPPEIATFFLAIGIPLIQGYGQTEAAPVISANPTRDNRIGSVGLPLAGVSVKLAPSGELLVQGDLVMQGYWNDPQTTAKILKNGWLHTGDLAEIDTDGYITIIGRSKDIIVNSGGENVSPSRVESRLTSQANIEQAMVYGDRRPWLSAVIVPSKDCIIKAGGKHEKLLRLIQDNLDTANARLATAERIRRFIIADGGFTIENKRLTPTLKIRRHIIRRDFRDRLDGLYN